MTDVPQRVEKKNKPIKKRKRVDVGDGKSSKKPKVEENKRIALYVLGCGCGTTYYGTFSASTFSFGKDEIVQLNSAHLASTATDAWKTLWSRWMSFFYVWIKSGALKPVISGDGVLCEVSQYVEAVYCVRSYKYW